MEYITGTLDFNTTHKSVITLGKFDGLHRGHRKLINRILEVGKEGLKTVVFTFDIPPRTQLGDGDFHVLLTNKERRKLLENKGIDYLVECPFIPIIKKMEPEVFIKEVLVKRLNVSRVIVGTDFRFGHGRKGTPQILRELGKQYNFKVEVLDKVCEGEREISSSYIREEIERGNIEKANVLLGYPYFIASEVISGRHLGSTIGMPTINQRPSKFKQIPPFGVYTSKTEVAEKTYRSVTNIGVKPTVGSGVVGVETYLFDCDEDLYGLEAKVELLCFQRPEIKFDSVEKLKEQLVKDKEAASVYK